MLARKWWTLIAVCLAVFMLLLDITIVNVALPDIQRSLRASFSDLQWVIDAYALMLAALLLTAGSLADLFGRRRVFALGLALFTIASLACGLAPSALVLILARGAQGIGGAIMFATSLALIAQEFHGRDRGTAFGVFGATTGAAVAIGPLVGGALTSGFGWESIFYLNVPLGIVAVVVTLTRLHETSDPDAERVDWLGVVTFSAALFALVYALIRGNEIGWGSTAIVALLVGAAVMLIAFLAAEALQSRPMFDLSLFRKPTFSGASIAGFAISASIFSLFLYITLYFQNVLGYSPLQTGLRFLPSTVLSFFVAAAAGKLSARVPVRALLAGGLGLVGVGLLLMRGLTAGSHWTALLAGLVVTGIGIGMMNPPLASTAIGVVPPARSGMASGINSTFRQVGIATGIAGLGALFQHQVRVGVMDASLAGTPIAGHAGQLTHAISSGGVGQALRAVPPGARQHVDVVIHTAFTGGLNVVFLVGAIVALVGAALSLVLVRGRDFVNSAAQQAPAAETEPAVA